MSAIDIKAGFFNLCIDGELKTFAGLVTQDGLYRFARMAFGFAPAPAAFQGVMNMAFARARRKLRAGVYMDDGSVGSTTLKGCWQDTLEAMICVLRQGLPINIKKCKFM